MQLSDDSIARLCVGGSPMIQPFSYDQLQPSTYDLRLGPRFVVPAVKGEDIDLRKPIERDDQFIWLGKGEWANVSAIRLFPGSLILGETIERFSIPPSIQGRLDGKSSLGRDGLMVHITAGVFDAGFEGVGVVEIYNASRSIWHLYEGMAIGQMSFQELDHPAARPYGTKGLGSHYQGQTVTTPSALGREQG